MPYGSGSIPLTRLLTIDEMQCSDSPQSGIYEGNFISSISDEIFQGMAIVAPDGQYAAISYGAMATVSDWSINGSTFSGSGTAVSADPKDEFDSNLTITAKIIPEYRLSGSYNIGGGDYGSFDLYSVPGLYRRGISPEAMAGDWDLGNQVTGASGSASLTYDGDLSGSDSDGCEYSGVLSLPDAKFNLFEITLTLTKCGAANGAYIGYGVQTDYFSLGDGRILRILASNESYAAVFDLFD